VPFMYHFLVGPIMEPVSGQNNPAILLHIMSARHILISSSMNLGRIFHWGTGPEIVKLSLILNFCYKNHVISLNVT
jgi:hypothetical protein